MVNKYTYLPFLGETVLPNKVLTEKYQSDFNTTTTVKVPPNSTVVYWATLPGTNASSTAVANASSNSRVTANVAYGDFSNSGVAIADSNGNAILKFKKPQLYKVCPYKNPSLHVHYRYNIKPGMLSNVETVYL